MPEFRKYGTDPKLDKLVDSKDWTDRFEAAQRCYGLEKLVYDKHWMVRTQVADQKYGLDILINDKEEVVRLRIVKQGYGLDILVKDPSSKIRAEVARQGYGFDILINDEYDLIRRIVARHGYGLDILINDSNVGIRRAIARQGYGLDKLINDDHCNIRIGVKEYLRDNGYKSIIDWAVAEPEKIYGNYDYQLEKDLRDIFYKIEESSKFFTQSSCDNVDEFFGNLSLSNDKDDFISIFTVDTKKLIATIHKCSVSCEIKFKLMIHFTEADEDFNIQEIIVSKEHFIDKLKEALEFLRTIKEYVKYADDLEACLS